MALMLYFAALAIASQVRVTLGGRSGSPSTFIIGLSSHPAPSNTFAVAFAQGRNPLLDATPGYLTQSLGHLGQQLLMSGNSPWWDPYNGLGAPLASDFQSAVFYPVSLVAFWLGLDGSGVDVVALADMFAAGVSAYWLARVLGLSVRGGLVVGTAFCLGGTFVWFGTLFANVVAWTPLSLALTVRIVNPGQNSAHRRRDIVLLGLVTFVQVTGGFPESLVMQGILLTLPILLVELLRNSSGRLIALLGIAEGFGLGLLGSAFLWVPFLTTLPAESLWNGPGLAFNHLPAWTDLVLLSPFAFGRGLRPIGVGDWLTFGGYLGVVSTWLAVMGLLRALRQRRGLALALLASALVSISWINGVPPLDWLGHLPALNRVPLARLAVAELALVVALLAGFAVDLPFRWSAWGVATVFTAVAVWLLVVGAPGPIALPNLLFTIGCLAAISGAAPAARALTPSLLKERPRGLGLAASTLALGLMVTELLVLSNLSWGVAPPRQPTWNAPPWVRYVRAHLDGGRLYATDGLLGQNYGGDFGVAELTYEDAVVPTRTAYFVTDRLAPPGASPLAFGGYPVAEMVPSRITGLELAGVTLVAMPDPGCQPGCDGLPLRFLDRGAGVGVFGVPDPQPFAWFPREVGAGSAVPSRSLQGVSVDRWKRGHVHYEGDASARVVESRSAGQVLRVHSSARRLLVLRQVDFPGWGVTVNGSPAQLLRVDGVFQGVIVPPGTSTVALSYTPPGLGMALVVSLAALVWALSRLLLRERDAGRLIRIAAGALGGFRGALTRSSPIGPASRRD